WIFLTGSDGWRNPRMIVDRDLVYARRPYDHFSGMYPGDLVHLYAIPTQQRYAVDAISDRNGFPNERDLQQADIAMLGDSYLQGVLVNAKDLSWVRLAEDLGTTVMNLGRVGYGPEQEVVCLRRFALPAKPRVVVWMLCEANDVTWDIVQYHWAHDDW